MQPIFVRGISKVAYNVDGLLPGWLLWFVRLAT